MWNLSTPLAFLALFACALGPELTARGEDVSAIVIGNGMVIDGTGAPARRADVLLRDKRIVAVGQVEAPAGARVIDAEGMVVTPGFIDAHAHGDPLETPEFENFLAMGVTTIVLGQDGSSPSPRTLDRWFDRVQEKQPGPNIAVFVGHGTVRRDAGVGTNPEPTATQLRTMQRLIEQALAAGCFGLSTGLEYLPGSYSSLDELAALAEPVGRAGGLVMSHMRSEDDLLIDGALDELIEQGRRGGCAVHVAHIKVIGGDGRQRAEQILQRMQAARDKGVTITADIYPYTASYTGIGILFPAWAKAPNDYAEVVRTRRDELTGYLRHRVNRRNGPEAVLLGTGKWQGRTLAQVARDVGKPFEDVLVDDIGPTGVSAAYFGMNEELQARLLVDPHVMICSDGSPTGYHPRGHGAFARIVQEFVIERGLLTLEEAVRKMTGLTAETVGLDRVQRGRIAVGYAADVLVFDPKQVRATATYENPHQLAEGFDLVIVNGRIVREDGRFTGQRAGRVLRRPSTSPGESP
jgi:N-acyl-D-amino-acid deacylase